MAKEIALSVKNVKKDFVLPQHKATSVKHAFVNVFRRNEKTSQHVLKGVSFDVYKGDFFGIVGRNGSGKSTLLKLIAGVYQPTAGSIELNGKLTPFIELGVGFNPELSGRDNVYLNGALLGFTREQMDEMYDDIVEFAELQPFMDQKLKNYSSGMQVRLAFSIAIKAKNEILIFDEVLAVGDEAFQRKCSDYFNEIKDDGKQTVILVTHSMEAVKKYCNRAALLKDGEIVALGDPLNVANMYSLENLEESHVDENESMSDDEKDDGVINLRIQLTSDKLVDQSGKIKFIMEYDVTRDMNTVPAISITDIDKNAWVQNDNMWNQIVIGSGHKKIRYECDLPKYIGDSNLKVQASVWSDKEEILSYVDDKYSPRLIHRRTDLKNIHDRGVATGIVNVSGMWEVV